MCKAFNITLLMTRSLAWLQVAYRSRIRARFFGPDYEREVRWTDGGGTQGGGSKAAAAAGSERMADKKEE